MSALQPGPLSVSPAATTGAGSECGCGRRRRTLEPLVNQKQRSLVQLIQPSFGKSTRISQPGRAVPQKALYVRQGYLRSAAVPRSPTQNFSHCPYWVVHFERLKVPKLHTGLIVLLLRNLTAKLERFSPLTLIALRPCKTWLTQAAEGAPFAMTVPPHATGGELLPAGAVVINKRAAWRSVGGFSWGTKVI